MKVLMTPIGSAGDNYPFIGLGRELARRGHEVSVLTSAPFAAAVRQAGLEYVEVITQEEYQATIANPDLWHPMRGFQTVAHLVSEQVKRIKPLLKERIEPHRTLVVAPSLDFASWVLQEKTGLPVVRIHLQPAILRSEYEIPVMSGRLDLSPLPRWTKRLFWRIVDACLIDRYSAAPVNELRAEAGLKPIKRIFAQAIHSPLLTLGLFPDWYCAPQPDWPSYLRLTGFPLYDEPDQGIPQPVETFLRAGPPPIVFTPGSAMAHGQAFFQAAVQACQRLNRRGLLLTRHDEHLPPNLPDSVQRFDYVPLSQMLHRCAAIVHHGGVGTTAAALAAGVPQILTPMAHDQPDNAARILRLGVGERLMPWWFTGKRLAAALNRLLTSPPVRERCAHYAHRCRQTNALQTSCDLIEQVLPSRDARSSVPSPGTPGEG